MGDFSKLHIYAHVFKQYFIFIFTFPVFYQWWKYYLRPSKETCSYFINSNTKFFWDETISNLSVLWFVVKNILVNISALETLFKIFCIHCKRENVFTLHFPVSFLKYLKRIEWVILKWCPPVYSIKWIGKNCFIVRCTQLS